MYLPVVRNTLCLTDRQEDASRGACGGGESMQARSAMRALQARTDSSLQSRLREGRQQTRGGQGDERPWAVGGGGGNSSSREGWRSKRCKSHSMDEQAEAGRRERSTPDASCKPHARKRPVGPSVLHRFAFFLGASGAAGPMARRQRLGQRGGAGLPKPTRPQFLPTASIAPARRGTLACAHCVRRVTESDNVSQHHPVGIRWRPMPAAVTWRASEQMIAAGRCLFVAESYSMSRRPQTSR